MHDRHHSATSVARLGALASLAAVLALGGCSDAETIHPFDSLNKIDWSGEFEHYNQPGLLGALIDRPAPAVSIRASGPYPGPLSDSVPPLLDADMADRVVAGPLLPALSAQARMNLAQASILAASAATGTAVAWKAADSAGTVIPARDVYLSRHGLVCRDLRQAVERPNAPEIEAVTLCRADIGEKRALWQPEAPD
jgi:surface antigen